MVLRRGGTPWRLRNPPAAGERRGRKYERIGERVSIFLNGRIWYANWQEGPKQQRKTLGTRNHEVARQKARALEAQLSGAVPRQAGTFDIGAVVQAYLDWEDSNDRADKTMTKYRYVPNRFTAHCHAAGVRLMHAISVQTVDDFGVRRRRDGMAAKTVYTELTIVRQWLNFAVTRRMLTMSLRPKEVEPGAKPWRPKNGEQRAVQLPPRAVAMLRNLPDRAAGDVGADARVKPARGRQGISKVSAKPSRGGRGARGGSAKFQQSHGGQQ